MAEKYTPEDLALSKEIGEIEKLTADQLERASQARAQAVIQSQNIASEMERMLRYMEQKNQAQSDEYDKTVSLLEQQREEVRIHFEILDALEKQQQKQEEITTAQKETNERMAGTIKSLASMVGFSTQFGESMKNAFKRRDGENFGKMIGRVSTSFVKGAASVFSFANVIGALISSTIQSVLALDDASAAFTRFTGAARSQAPALIAAAKGLFEYGMGYQEAAAANAALYAGVTEFSKGSVEQQRNLTTTTAQLEKLGVSSRDTADIIQMMSRSFGMTHEQGLQVVKDLEQFAANTGQASGEVVAGFNRASKYLGVFGKKAKKIYMETSKLARVLGMDTNELIDSMKKFDRFDTAAESVAALNAMLGSGGKGGSYIDTMSMVMERDPAKRMMMFKEALDNSRVAFADMNPYMREAIANQMDMNAAQVDALVAMDPSEIEEMGKKQADMAKRAADAATVMEKLRQTMSIILVDVVGPLLEKFGGPEGIAESFGSFAKKIGEVIKSFKEFIDQHSGTMSFLGNILSVVIKLLPYLSLLALGIGAIITGLKLVALFAGLPALLFSIAAAAAAMWAAITLPLILFLAKIGIMIGVLYAFRDTLISMWGTVINTITSVLNLLIKGANLIPGIEIPLIPKLEAGWEGFADGVTNFSGGTAIVGEQGPELVTMGRGANVVTNENTNKIAAAASAGGGTAGSQALIAALDRNTAALQGGSGKNIAPVQQAGGGTVNNVVLHMNDREFAKVVDERVDKVLQNRG